MSTETCECECSNCNPPASIPLIGPPDGWPRTKDGHLVKPGSLFYDADGVESRILCVWWDITLSQFRCSAFVVDTAVEGNVTINLVTAIKPEPPVTLESALRECIEQLCIAADWFGDLRAHGDVHKAIAKARKALGEVE